MEPTFPSFLAWEKGTTPGGDAVADGAVVVVRGRGGRGRAGQDRGAGQEDDDHDDQEG